MAATVTDTLPAVLAVLDRQARIGSRLFSGSPESRRAFFADFTPNQLLRALSQLNKAVDGPDNGQFSDLLVRIECNGVADLTPPAQHDRRRLFERAAQAASAIARDDRLPTAVALRRIGLLLAGTINLMHAFPTANGRPARVLSYLAMHGYSSGTQRQAISTLATEFERQVWDVNPGAVTDDIVWWQKVRAYKSVLSDAPKPTGLTFDAVGHYVRADLPSSVPSHHVDDVLVLLNDDAGSFAALYPFVAHNGLLTADMIKEAYDSEGQSRPKLETKMAIDAVAKAGLLAGLIEEHQRLRAEVVEVFIEQMAEPTLSLPRRETYADYATVVERYEQTFERSTLEGLTAPER